MIVVSEIGEQWSPQTAPAIHAEIAMIIIVSFFPSNACTTIGIRIPNVPQLVPVANARKHPTRKMIAGRRFTIPSALPATMPATYSAAPRLSVIDFSVHAKTRIRIAGTIALNPSGRHAIHSSNFSTRLTRYSTIVITKAKKLPYTSPWEASLPENASTKPTPSKNPPV